jgi:hypothetical protein
MRIGEMNPFVGIDRFIGLPVAIRSGVRLPKLHFPRRIVEKGIPFHAGEGRVGIALGKQPKENALGRERPEGRAVANIVVAVETTTHLVNVDS